MVRVLSLVLLVPMLQGCTSAKDPWDAAKPGQRRVLATFPPLYSMTQAIAGEDAYVLSLLSNVGPHDAKDNPSDMFKLRRAELVVMNGLGLDDRFMDLLIRGSMNKTLRVLKAGDAVPEQDRQDAPKHEDHSHGKYDPHVWLGPPQAIVMVRAIAEQLGQLDPAHKSGYDRRADALVAELEKLHQHGLALLEGKKNRCLVTTHESLCYFARAFNLDLKGSLQTQPGVDPDPARLAQLAEMCKKHDVRVIAIEPQYDAKLARTLQKHLAFDGRQVQLAEIDTLETAPLAPDSANPEPDFYLRTMRANIEAIARALP